MSRYGLPGPLSVIALAAGVLALLLGIGRGGKSTDRGDEPGPPGGAVRARILRAVDGDTAVAAIGGATERVRYIGVDTPESVKPGTPVQCFGHEAAERNAELVEGRPARLVLGAERRDPYGRLLAYVHVGGRLVNAALVREGFARTLEIAPNTALASRFARLQSQAAAADRGLWGKC